MEFEGIAAEVRRRAGVRPGELIVITRAAARLLGPDAIAADEEMEIPAYLCRTFDGFQIVANPRSKDLRFHISHELGEWALKTLAHFSGTHTARERAANYIAAAILAPADEVRSIRRARGERIGSMARHFGMSQTAMVLRLAEVQGDERAVVTVSGNVLIRTQGAFPWETVPVVGVARGESRWLGLAKARLRGGIDEGRVALRVR